MNKIDVINSRKLGTASFGYPSNKPCVVCNTVDRNQSEPRFGYTVCIYHQHIGPTLINMFYQR